MERGNIMFCIQCGKKIEKGNQVYLEDYCEECFTELKKEGKIENIIYNKLSKSVKRKRK